MQLLLMVSTLSTPLLTAGDLIGGGEELENLLEF
jgi:hypothetical protein